MPKKAKAAPSDGADTAGNLQAAWPFPTPPAQGTANLLPLDHPDRHRADEAETATADRIRVAAISLYTDPAQNIVERIALEQLIESPFNPRTHYDEKALHDLAETVRGVGVMQPLLARPVSYASITHNGKPVQAYEIVFGHRRYRAAKIAGEAVVPVIVRDLTDAQSAQLQAIENVQRQDLDALEEAKGYANYIAAHGVTKDQLAEEIGLSRSHVYSRLKLLNGVPAVQEALRSGEIEAEVALYLSRIPHAKLQEKALASLKSNGMQIQDGGRASVRRIREFLRERFTLKLSEAMFDTKDEQLLAHAGACTDCSKRTGNSPEHQDLAETHEGITKWGGHTVDKGEPNLCTDPDCFEAKKKAHLAAKAAVLEAKGKTVITGGKARAAISAQGEIKNGYIPLKDVKALLAKAGGKKAKGAEAVDVPTVVIQDPRTGKTHDAVRAEDLKAAGVKVKEQPAGGGGASYQEQQRRQEAERVKREAAAAVETKVNCAILTAVRKEAAAVPRSAFDLQMVASVTVDGVDYGARNLLARLHGFKNRDELDKKIGQMPVEQLTLLMLDCALVDNVLVHGYGNDKPKALMAAAKRYGVDIAAIRKEVTATAADTKTQDLLQGADQAEEEEADLA